MVSDPVVIPILNTFKNETPLKSPQYGPSFVVKFPHGKSFSVPYRKPN